MNFNKVCDLHLRHGRREANGEFLEVRHGGTVFRLWDIAFRLRGRRRGRVITAEAATATAVALVTALIILAFLAVTPSVLAAFTVVSLR